MLKKSNFIESQRKIIVNKNKPIMEHNTEVQMSYGAFIVSEQLNGYCKVWCDGVGTDDIFYASMVIYENFLSSKESKDEGTSEYDAIVNFFYNRVKMNNTLNKGDIVVIKHNNELKEVTIVGIENVFYILVEVDSTKSIYVTIGDIYAPLE